MSHPFDNSDEREQFLASLWGLHEEITEAVSTPQMDPGHLIRLIALGINHCMVGVAAALSDPSGSVPAEDPRQLAFSFLADLDAESPPNAELSRSDQMGGSGKADEQVL